MKSLEKVLATKIDSAKARALLSPLLGIYELRLADAHLPSAAIEEAIALVGLDETTPFVTQGLQLLEVCVTSLYRIAKVIEDCDTASA